jgi:hypothetical protein
MTRALLASTLWGLCLVVGLWSTRVSAENTDKGRRLCETWVRLQWLRNVNTDLDNEVERRQPMVVPVGEAP